MRDVHPDLPTTPVHDPSGAKRKRLHWKLCDVPFSYSSNCGLLESSHTPDYLWTVAVYVPWHKLRIKSIWFSKSRSNSSLGSISRRILLLAGHDGRSLWSQHSEDQERRTAMSSNVSLSSIAKPKSCALLCSRSYHCHPIHCCSFLSPGSRNWAWFSACCALVFITGCSMQQVLD